MATTVSVVIARRRSAARGVANLVPDAQPVAAQAITASGASQLSSTAIPADDAGAADYLWIITASGGAVWIKFGAAAVAAAGDQWLVPDGQSFAWSARAGEKCAVINA